MKAEDITNRPIEKKVPIILKKDERYKLRNELRQKWMSRKWPTKFLLFTYYCEQ